MKADLNWLEPGVIDVCGKAPSYVSGGGQGPSFCSKASWDYAYLKGIKQILSTQKKISFAIFKEASKMAIFSLT